MLQIRFQVKYLSDVCPAKMILQAVLTLFSQIPSMDKIARKHRSAGRRVKCALARVCIEKIHNAYLCRSAKYPCIVKLSVGPDRCLRIDGNALRSRYRAKFHLANSTPTLCLYQIEASDIGNVFIIRLFPFLPFSLATRSIAKRIAKRRIDKDDDKATRGANEIVSHKGYPSRPARRTLRLRAARKNRLARVSRAILANIVPG